MTNKTSSTAARDSNVELLRILCMLLIICGHIIMTHKYEDTFDTSWYINQTIRPFCSVAVNVYILISGYYGIKLKYRKLLNINWMVTFYSVAFLMLSIILKIHTFSFTKDWMQLIPVVTKQYWFITIYFILCLISPFLNTLTENLDKNSFKRLLTTLFSAFVIIPTFSYITNFPSITQDAGYGIVNFVFLYLIGRYTRIYNPTWCRGAKHLCLFCYFISMALCAVFQIFYSRLLGFTFDALLSYDTIFVFCGAVCLFLYFIRAERFHNKFVNSLAAPCLAVYVLHLHPLFYPYFFKEILKVNSYTNGVYIAFLLLAPIFIYLCCCIIEASRNKLVHTFRKLIEICIR